MYMKNSIADINFGLCFFYSLMLIPVVIDVFVG
jgi:hypothetical protein